MPTLFTRIIHGEITCYKIYEDDLTFAFLDIFPYQLGHTLIIPKIEVDHFFDLPEPWYTALFQTAKKIAPAVQQATGSIRVGMVLEWLEVPHVHIKMIPIHQSHDLDSHHKHEETPEAMKAIQAKICAYLN